MRRLLITLLLILPFTASAQSTQSSEDALKVRLLHKPLYLQQGWGADKLHFDAAGAVVGTVPLVSYTLSGIDVDSVKLKGGTLQLWARRVGLEFVDKVPKRVTLQVRTALVPGTQDEEMKLTIDAPAGGDFGPALDAIFTDKLADLVPRMPVEWQSFARVSFLSEEAPAKSKSPAGRRVGGGVTAPRVTFAPQPQYTEAARAVRWSGNALVYLQVDTAGMPVKLKLLRPLGLGLDEAALAAVRAYKFQPAMENGQPVAVEMNVEVNFQIF